MDLCPRCRLEGSGWGGTFRLAAACKDVDVWEGLIDRLIVSAALMVTERIGVEWHVIH